MTNEITSRRIFAVLQVVFGLIAPVIFTTSFIKLWGTTNPLVTASFYQLAYWLGIPAVCFSVLAWVSLSHRENQFRISRAGMWGAAIAGYLAFVLPATLLWLTTGENYRGGGANIGVALLVVAMPVYLPVVMAMGLGFGGGLRGQQKHT
ncbi:MAG TPA: hypothetical protein VGA00_12685 [Acidiferrobacterales bacterium]